MWCACCRLAPLTPNHSQPTLLWGIRVNRVYVSIAHQMYSRTPSTLFSPTKHRASKARKSVLAVARAVVGVMIQELGDGAQARWKSLLDEELGEPIFARLNSRKCPAPQLVIKSSAKSGPHEKAATAPWVPAKPKVTELLLEAFQRSDELLLPGDRLPLILEALPCLGQGNRPLSKLMARRAVQWILSHRLEALRASGEIPEEQLAHETRLQRTVARVAADLLAYLAVAARELCEGDEGGEVLELHSTDQRLVGMATRGCGLVFCEKGRLLFQRAVAQARNPVKPE